MLQELASESGAQHWEAIDCMRFLRGSRLATKSLDGRMLVWDTAKRLHLASWKVPPSPAVMTSSSPARQADLLKQDLRLWSVTEWSHTVMQWMTVVCHWPS